MTQRGTEPSAHGRYRILGAIHKGGMGQILLAEVEGAEGFSRRLVLKGVRPDLDEDDVSDALFAREARLMAKLDHPNIVRVFDAPVIDGQAFLAMEYVRGRNLHQVIQKSIARGRAVPFPIVAHIVAEVLRGLHAAHRATDAEGRPLGIVHRDVSPGNVLIGFFGEVKLTDFGIAKMADAPNLTGPRSIRGKARYVAPELVRGAEASPRSDAYSAAVVLAELLTLQPLWERKDAVATLSWIVTEARELTLDRIFARAVERRGLRELLGRALALHPEDRFGDALELAEALDALGRATGGPVTQAELGAFVRELFADAADLPREALSPREAQHTPLDQKAALIASASYLTELQSIRTEDEAPLSLPDRAAHGLARVESRLLRMPPAMLIMLGILIGALTALGGSLLALLTH